MPYRRGRAFLDALSALDPMPSGVEVRAGRSGGVRSLLIVPEGAGDAPRMVWLHGGAFCFGSPKAYSTFVAHLAKAVGVSILAPAYRLAPEHPYPAAFDDSLAAYAAVAAEFGPPILGGDSAGGGLTLSAAIRLCDEGRPMPRGLLLMSPWVDLTGSGGSMRSNAGRDALLRAETLPGLVRAYAGGLDPRDPLLSPLGADLAGLPATLIQCGEDELFLSEGVDLAKRLEDAGGDTKLQVFDGMWHDFQLHAGMLDESARAVGQMAAWAKPLLDE